MMGSTLIPDVTGAVYTSMTVKTLCIVILSILVFSPSTDSARRRVSKASCNVTYISPDTGRPVSEIVNGSYGTGLHAPESGRLVSIRTVNNTDTGCTDYNMNTPTFKWVALVQRGGCKFHDKIQRAKARNASAVVIYNSQNRSDAFYMIHKVEGIVAVSIPRADGIKLLNLMNQGTNVNISITERRLVAPKSRRGGGKGSKQFLASMVLALLSALCLLVISLGWCVFFVVERCKG